MARRRDDWKIRAPTVRLIRQSLVLERQADPMDAASKISMEQNERIVIDTLSDTRAQFLHIRN
jgi:hypothetical protein